MYLYHRIGHIVLKEKICKFPEFFFASFNFLPLEKDMPSQYEQTEILFTQGCTFV